MHDAQFADAAKPEAIRILKLWMQPYSLGHEILLNQRRNALLLDADSFSNLPEFKQHRAIIEAVLICCQNWNQNQNPHRWLWLWELRKGKKYSIAIEQFRAYRNAGCSYPPPPNERADLVANGEGEKGREIGAPLLARLYNFVAHLPESEIRVHGDSVFDFPLSLAAFLYFSHLEVKGDLRIENSKEAGIRQEIDGHIDYFTKQKEATCPA